MANEIMVYLSFLVSVCSLVTTVFSFLYVLQGRLSVIETDLKWIKHQLGKVKEP